MPAQRNRAARANQRLLKPITRSPLGRGQTADALRVSVLRKWGVWPPGPRLRWQRPASCPWAPLARGPRVAGPGWPRCPAASGKCRRPRNAHAGCCRSRWSRRAVHRPTRNEPCWTHRLGWSMRDVQRALRLPHAAGWRGRCCVSRALTHSPPRARPSSHAWRDLHALGPPHEIRPPRVAMRAHRHARRPPSGPWPWHRPAGHAGPA